MLVPKRWNMSGTLPFTATCTDGKPAVIREKEITAIKRFLDEYYGPIFAPQMVEAWTAAGTPAQCVEHLRDLVRDGAKAIALRITSWDQRGQFDRLVNEVLPRVNV